MAAAGIADAFWGIHLLAFFSVWARVLFLALIMLLFFSRVRKGLMDVAQWLTECIPPWARFVLLSGFALVMFYVFRSAVHLLGDGALLLREWEIAEIGPLHRTDRAPLVFYLMGHLKELDYPAEVIHWIYSWAGGIFYVIVALLAARFVGRDKTERIVVLGLLLTHGGMLCFFGYVETYALLSPVALIYLWFGARHQSTPSIPWIPAVLLGVLIPLHMMHAMLIPSLAVLAWQSTRRIWAVGASLAVAGVLAIALLWLSGIAPWMILEHAGEAPFLSIGTDFHRPYGLVSLAHMADIFNQYLLVAPAAVGILFLCGRNLKPETWRSGKHLFAVCCGLSGIVYTNCQSKNWRVSRLGCDESGCIAFDVLVCVDFFAARQCPQ